MRLKNISLTTKMAITISLLFFVIFAGGALLLFNHFGEEYKKIIANQQFEFISDLANDTDKKLEEAKTLIKMSIGKPPDYVVNDAKRLQSYFMKKVKGKPFLNHFFDKGIFLFYENGALIGQYPEDKERYKRNFSDVDYFKKTAETKRPYISNPFIDSRFPGEPLIVITNPIFNEKKELKAIVGGCISILKDNFLGEIINVKIGKTGYVYLFDTDRRIIIHPDKTRIMKQDIPVGANRLFDRAIAGFEGTDETITSRGLHAITSFKRLKNKDWILGANFPIQEAHYPIKKAQKYVAIFTIIGIILSISIITLLMKGFLNPLVALTGEVEKIGFNSGQRRLINISAKGEIAKLEEAFNEMLKKLYSREEELLRLSRAVEFSSAIVLITDVDGIIEYVNPKFTEVTGYTKEEVLGKKPNILKSDKKTWEEYRLLWETIKSGKDWQGIFLNKKKNGEFYWASASISPVKDVKGNIINFVCIQEDITKIKRAEEELQKAKEMAEAANEAKSNFLASMSHEIRTPMNAIIGVSDLLLETELTPDQLKYVKIFKNAGENLLNLINDILDLSKIEAGHIEIEEIDFNLIESVEKTCEIMSLKAHEKGLEFICHIHNEVPAHLIGDPFRLRQVLTNLIGNAIKFTNKGEVVVEVALLKDIQNTASLSSNTGLWNKKKIKEGHEYVDILFSVKDTGIGIPEDKIEAIFDKFTQIDTSTTRKYGGTGLGLAISKNLVELMGGSLWVESAPGTGSTFFFTLPFAIQKRYTERPVEEKVDLKGKRILIIDDNATNRIILTDTLSAWGIDVYEAESGENGIFELKSKKESGTPFDLILLDYHMPLMDGFNVAEIIRKDPSISDTPIIMLTSDYGRQHSEKSRGLNITAFITKPVKREELKTVISDAISSSKKIPEVSISEVEKIKSYKLQEPLNILIAEDSKDNRLLLQAFLKDLPFNLFFAKDGEEAVNLFKERSYSLIIMDIQMPVKDGYTATMEIRQMERERNLTKTPIIALTAYALKEEIQKSLEAGCDVHITKPVKKTFLIKAIEEYIKL
ncbi:MAG TPA: response regulator [Syntrophorhabdaceae bacterium]|nr:response regulator [Syntrophorhabdaceae bacterium]